MTRLLHHRIDGPEGAPALLLGPSLGTSLAVWDAQVPALARDHRVVRWDLPGHGSSQAELLASRESGPATMDRLARLVLDLADHLGLERFDYAGISLGGGVGAWLALRHPDRVSRLVMVCSSAWFGPPEPWHERADLVRAKGTEVMVDAASGRWFTAELARSVIQRQTGGAAGPGTASAVDPGVGSRMGLEVSSHTALGVGSRTELGGGSRTTSGADSRAGSAGDSLPEGPAGDSKRSLRTAASGLLDDLRAASADGYAACCEALAGYDIRSELSSMTVPTLVIAGRDDPATPPAHARELADGIPGASLVEVAHAAHLANVEQPRQVLAALLGHLAGPATYDVVPGGGETAAGTGGRATPADPPNEGGTVSNAGDAVSDAGDDPAAGRGTVGTIPGGEETMGTRHAAGMAVRRAVLGDEHVDRAVANTTGFTADFQDLITRYAWGEIWTRPGLDRRTRSCITLTALVAGGHLEELAMHVKAALRNGLTPDDIKEVLLQTAIYCGVPAANAAFAVAQRNLEPRRTS